MQTQQKHISNEKNVTKSRSHAYCEKIRFHSHAYCEKIKFPSHAYCEKIKFQSQSIIINYEILTSIVRAQVYCKLYQTDVIHHTLNKPEPNDKNCRQTSLTQQLKYQLNPAQFQGAYFLST